MSNQNEFRFLNKGISTPMGILIIVLVIITAGGIIVWQNLETSERKEEPLEKSVQLGEISNNCIIGDWITCKDYKDCCIYNIVFSPNGKQVSYIKKVENDYSVVLNGKEGNFYEKVCCLKFSPNGEHFAYLVKKTKKEGEEFIVLDGKEGKAYKYINRFLFSPDSEHLAYDAKTNGGWVIVFDTKESKKYSIVDVPFFSPDSKHLFYEGNGCLILDGEKVSEEYHPPIFSPDGKHIAYIKEGNIILDGEKVSRGSNPVFSPNSQYLAYLKGSGYELINIVDGERRTGDGGRYGDILNIVFSPDSEHLAYVKKEIISEMHVSPVEIKESVVLDDKVIAGHEYIYEYDYYAIWDLMFSPDSQHLVYRIEKGSFGGGVEKEFVVLDGKEGEKYDDVSFPIFSPDSQHLAYRAKENSKWFIVFDNKKGKFYDELEKDGYSIPSIPIISRPVFSPDSQRLVYAIGNKNGKRFLVINGKEGKEYDYIDTKFFFSSNGEYIFHGARVGNNLWWIVEKVK